MPDFEITSGVDPFLSVSLGQGEQILAVSRAMVSMSASLSIRGRLQGGLIRSLVRKNAQGESAFLQVLEAPAYPGKALLSPTLPGDIRLVELGQGNDLFINDGCFLAAGAGIDILTKLQSADKAIFSGTGGFVIMKASGEGTVAISGFGSMTCIELRTEEAVFDHNHVVAWDATLQYSPSFPSAKGKGLFSKLFGGLLSSVTSGEGLVNRFAGTGKVYVCSRNRDDLLSWIKKGLGKEKPRRK